MSYGPVLCPMALSYVLWPCPMSYGPVLCPMAQWAIHVAFHGPMSYLPWPNGQFMSHVLWPCPMALSYVLWPCPMPYGHSWDYGQQGDAGPSDFWWSTSLDSSSCCKCLPIPIGPGPMDPAHWVVGHAMDHRTRDIPWAVGHTTCHG